MLTKTILSAFSIITVYWNGTLSGWVHRKLATLRASGSLGAFTAHVFLPICDKSKVYLLNHANRVDLEQAGSPSRLLQTGPCWALWWLWMVFFFGWAYDRRTGGIVAWVLLYGWGTRWHQCVKVGQSFHQR